jgi:hypothetical protein
MLRFPSPPFSDFLLEKHDTIKIFGIFVSPSRGSTGVLTEKNKPPSKPYTDIYELAEFLDWFYKMESQGLS